MVAQEWHGSDSVITLKEVPLADLPDTKASVNGGRSCSCDPACYLPS